MKYDDAEVSCPMCSNGLDAVDLCECDDGPLCCRCHRAYHVELRQRGAPGWIGGAV